MRDVYFDPFGSYTQGYDRGTARQMDMEAATRQARDSDYKYNVLNPYELKSVKREDAFGEATQGGRLQLFKDTVGMSGNNLYNSNAAIADDTAQVFGIGTPRQNLMLNRYNYHVGDAPAGGAPASAQPQAGVMPYNVAPAQPQAAQAPAAAAPQTPATDPGAAFWQRVHGLGRYPTPDEANAIASQMATQYGIAPDQLHAMIVAAKDGPLQRSTTVPDTAAPYTGYHTPDMTRPLGPALMNAPAAPPIAQYNVGAPTAQAPQMASGAPTYVYDSTGKLVANVPNMADNIVSNANYSRTIAERAVQQANMQQMQAAQQARDDLLQKYYYSGVVDRQTQAGRANSQDSIVESLIGN